MDYDLKLITIEDSYIDFLKRYQIDIMPNRKVASKHSRLYLSIRLSDDGIYAIPLCSPKESDYSGGSVRHNFLTIVRLLYKKELLGSLRISHMIVAPVNAMRYYDIRSEKDLKYKSLVNKEYLCIKKMQNLIRKNAERLLRQKESEDEHYLYTNQEPPKYLTNTIDYKFVAKMSLEYAPGMSEHPKKDQVVEDVEELNDDMNFVMLDKYVTNPLEKYIPDTPEFDIENEMMELRRLVSETDTEEKVEKKVEVNLEVTKKPIEPSVPINEIDPTNRSVVKPKAEIEIKSPKAILLELKSIHSGHSSVDIVIDNYFKKGEIVYQILAYDYKSLYALIKNCKSNDIMLVSNFPKDEECGWERPINFGNQDDSLKRGIKTYQGFIK